MATANCAPACCSVQPPKRSLAADRLNGPRGVSRKWAPLAAIPASPTPRMVALGFVDDGIEQTQFGPGLRMHVGT